MSVPIIGLAAQAGLSTLAFVSLAVVAALHTSAAASATTANPFFWYVTRAAAVSAYIFLTATVVLGLVRSLGRVTRVRLSWIMDEAHQYLALLTAALVAVHLLSLLLDPLIPFSMLNMLVPLSQPYRPLAVDLGVLSLYGLVVVLASSWLRRRIKYTTWRKLHYTSFAVFLLVTLHGIFAGSDAGQPWMIRVYEIAAGAVILLVLVRIFWPSQSGSAARPTAEATAVAPARSRPRSLAR